MKTAQSQHSPLFRQFRTLPLNQHFAIIRFLMSYESDIEELAVEEQIIIWSYYVQALHEEGGLEPKLIPTAKMLLEYSIIYNIQFVDGVDIYLRTLQQLAIAYLRTEQYEEATRIATQLCQLAPKQKLNSQLLQNCLQMQRPSWVQGFWAWGLLAILVGVLTSILNILLVETFYTNFYPTMLIVENAAYIIGILLFVVGSLGHYYYVNRQMKLLQTT
jgi:hypothetical protein